MSKQTRSQGELESLVLECLWDADQALTSKQVLDAISPDGAMALTTVLTVLSRLGDKGLVLREEKSPKSHLYRPANSREQHTANLMLQMFSNGGDKSLALSLFAGGLSSEALAALRDVIKPE